MNYQTISKKQKIQNKESLMMKFLNGVEKIGNKLPDPVTIFVILSIFVFIISAIVANSGISAVHPGQIDETTGKNLVVQGVNLLSKEQLQLFLANVVSNFTGFAPLGLVLVTMLGAGLAERSGYMEAVMKTSVTKVPKKLLTGTIIFIGIMANAVADAGFVVLPPLAALVFLGVGRHPLVGLFCAYAGVAAGFSASLIVSMIDILLGGFTTSAAQIIDSTYIATPAMNWYFLITSTLLLVVIGTFITEKYLAPRFENTSFDKEDNDISTTITDREKKAMKYASISFLLSILVLVGLCIGPNAFMKDPETGSLLSSNSTLMKGMVPIITILFFIPGLTYGVVNKTIKNDKDLAQLLYDSMAGMGSYIVLAFVAGQFLALFNASNISSLLSIKGAELLKSAGLTGPELIIAFVLFSAVINLFMGSASAKWAVMAPVFVPMFLILGYDPALTQIAYRIGDSITNPISPIFTYFPVLLAFAKKYDKNIGIGTVMASMMPYSIIFGIAWILLLVVFIVFNIPLGPGGTIFY